MVEKMKFLTAKANTITEDTESEGATLEKQDQAYLQSVKQFVQEDPPGDPTTYRQATEGGDSEKWKTAMKEEIDSLERMGTWKVVPLPEGRKPITCKWVYRTKRDADGNPTRYKARLVARGFSQVYGEDYMETHAPVTRLETIQLCHRAIFLVHFSPVFTTLPPHVRSFLSPFSCYPCFPPCFHAIELLFD